MARFRSSEYSSQVILQHKYSPFSDIESAVGEWHLGAGDAPAAPGGASAADGPVGASGGSDLTGLITSGVTGISSLIGGAMSAKQQKALFEQQAAQAQAAAKAAKLAGKSSAQIAMYQAQAAQAQAQAAALNAQAQSGPSPTTYAVGAIALLALIGGGLVAKKKGWV